MDFIFKVMKSMEAEIIGDRERESKTGTEKWRKRERERGKGRKEREMRGVWRRKFE